MTDLVAGRYPLAEEEWVLDGTPFPPYRRTISRRDITSTWQPTNITVYSFAVPVQAGDIFNYVSFAVKTAAGTQLHAWAALYNGVGTGAALLAQTTDAGSTAWASGTAQKLQLSSQVVADVAQPGTPQGPPGGPGQWSTTPAGPLVIGAVVYCSSTTTFVLDGMAGGAVAGEVVVTGQSPISSSSSSTLASTATAPAVLPTMAAVAGAVPYLLLSRQ